MAKRPADWMPLAAVFDHVVTSLGADIAFDVVVDAVESGDVAAAKWSHSQRKPVPQPPQFWKAQKFWPPSGRHSIWAESSDPGEGELAVFVLRSDAMKVWGAGRTASVASDAPGQRGRPAEYDWEIFAAEVARRVLVDKRGKIRKTARGLVPDMAQWCHDNWNKEPGETELREHIGKVLRHLNK